MVEGTIYLSRDKEYKDGEKIIFYSAKLTHYSYAEGFWPDHYVMSTLDKHFFLASRDQDASVA